MSATPKVRQEIHHKFKPKPRRAYSLLQRDLTIMLRGSAVPASIGFFLMIGCLAPLALGSDRWLLANVAPGLIWILATLAALLGLDSLYQEELNDGSLSVFVLSPMPLVIIVLIKSFAFWLTVCVPLACAAPAIIFLMGGGDDMAWMIFVSLLVGTPALVLLGGTLAAICAGLRRGTGLVIFLAMPFFAPAFIFGTRVLNEGVFNVVALSYLAAFSLQALAFCPFLTAAAIRQQME